MSRNRDSPMRAIIGTNVFISYLLGSSRETPITAVIEAALLGDFTLLLPQEIVEEFAWKVATKPYLAARLTSEQATRLISELSDVAETIPGITEEIPRVVRDARDDYLLAYAFVGRADYLVTGDDNLLSLTEMEGLKIVTPSEFARVLRSLP